MIIVAIIGLLAEVIFVAWFVWEWRQDYVATKKWRRCTMAYHIGHPFDHEIPPIHALDVIEMKSWISEYTFRGTRR